MHQMIRNMVNRLKKRTRVEALQDDSCSNAKQVSRRTVSSSAKATTGGILRFSLGLAAAVFASQLLHSPANAQGVVTADYDMAGSGFVAPAGMPPIGSPQMRMMMGTPVAQVGYNAYGCGPGGCDQMGCDGMMMQGGMDRMVCGTCGGGGGCGCNSVLGGGGILGKWKANGGPACFFCRGSGCTACKELPFGYGASCLAACLECCAPYEGASICNQRWYDLSIEALLLDRNLGGAAPGVVTTQGINGTPVLTLGDVGSDDLEAGVRVSAAMICGVGGNLEMTYMGGNEWSGSGLAESATPTLYSFISEFGTNPGPSSGGANDAGFDDTDRSFQQSLSARSRFHSAELNYRRRTMFPYCRFQSSWLFGLRYVRYDDALTYATLGDTNNTGGNNGLRFYNSDSQSKNSIFGPQGGFDFWWNVCPGMSLGFGAKGAWVQNDIDRRTRITANSLGFGATPGGETLDDGAQKSTYLADFELKGVYRFSHSWSVRGSYYFLYVDKISFGGVDAESARDILQSSTLVRPFVYDSLELSGFTVGAEYMW